MPESLQPSMQSMQSPQPSLPPNTPAASEPRLVSASDLAQTWAADLDLWNCPQCGWVVLRPDGETYPTCPGCLNQTLERLRSTPFGHLPEQIVPFRPSDGLIDEQLRRFTAAIPYPPDDLNATRVWDRMRRIYLPFWLVDGVVTATWQAEVGFNYQVVSHQERYSDTGWQTREVSETKVRWEPRVGRIQRAYHNLGAPAIERWQEWQQSLGHFDLSTAQPYHADLLGRAEVRLPDRPTTSAWPDAARAFSQAASEECRQASGADHLRAFLWSPQFGQLNWTLMLLPLFVSYYLDDQGQPQRLLFHGQTGAVAGRRWASMVRAKRRAIQIALVGAALLVVALLLILIGPRIGNPRLSGLGATLALTGAVTLIGALAPLAQVAFYNRQNAP